MAKQIENISINGESYEVGKIYARMGITFERFVELFERDFYCPILPSDPTGNTTTYTDTDSRQHQFQRGQFAVVEDVGSEGGFKVWQCLSNNGTEAVWKCDMDVVSRLLESKQDEVTDLEEIRRGASLGASAIQSEKYTSTEVDELLDKVNSSKEKVFIGTEQEYDEAYKNGLIPIGSLVIILDESEQLEDTIALLGTAVIGRMILGKS